MNVTDIIFGVDNSNNDVCIDVLNFCILHMKGFIIEHKVHEKKCEFPVFVKSIVKYVEIEKYLATINRTENLFNKYWDKLYKAII